MIGLDTAIHEVFAGRDWSQEERDAIEDVLDAADAFTSFRLPLEEALKVGALATGNGMVTTPAFGRVRAILAARLDDPRRRSLLDMLDIVIRTQPGIQTNKGWFSHAEIAANGFVIRTRPLPNRADGGLR